MKERVDARGLACPAPVVRTKEALKGGATEIEVLVDNPTARDNVCRFASSQGCVSEVFEEEGGFRIAITRGSEEAGAESGPGHAERAVVVLSSEVMGRGEDELGRILVKAFLNTLAESDPPPWRVVLFNRGVLLAVEGGDGVEALSNLRDMGVEVLVCGTCLDYFQARERLAVGTVSNMYDILTTMLSATNSVTI
ncbi:MAG: sulfurtransferase-like selenium metabolism protein YedF [Actinobacteria bacterium]|nr:sulfurtransferase-like selenium metabolism protein YedF [Actinomycetota bacterium]MDI6831434.1 sulfurtransferase-like selenium metabolism protein YedF [Actinomycetota bacterium]